ncbi:MAG TPA: hypothetical protein VFQ45_14835 [Longimicrobium sp.]|nr:hypothetical protein [Longimicrobium sp.]
MRKLVLLPLATICFAGCDAAGPSPASAPTPGASVRGVLEPVDTIALRHSPGDPLIRLSGLDIRAGDGAMVVSDASGGTVQLFARDGRLLRLLGRKGSGPAEFQIPYSPRFDPDGRIHVPDARNTRITVFSPDGTVSGHVPLTAFVRVTAAEPEPAGTYLVAATRTEEDPHTLFRIDDRGRVLQPLLPLADRASEDPMLAGIRRASFAVQGDSLYVALTTADSVWSVPRGGGQVQRLHLRVPGYTAPKPPRPGIMSMREAAAWGRTFSMAAAVFATDGAVAVPFVRGVLFEGDSTTLLFRQPGGSWISIADPPIIVRAANGYFAALEDPYADTLRIVLYRRRRG